MKYRTVIELICNAHDKDEASNLAGDYLKGEVDFGVEMHCKTETLVGHRVIKYAVSSAIAILIFASFLLKVTPISVDEKIQGSPTIGFQNTFTVQPVLKTKHKSDFKKEWEQKKDEAVLEYLKK